MHVRRFTGPAARSAHPESDHAVHSRLLVPDRYGAYTRDGGDSRAAELVAVLRTAGREFAELWSTPGARVPLRAEAPPAPVSGCSNSAARRRSAPTGRCGSWCSPGAGEREPRRAPAPLRVSERPRGATQVTLFRLSRLVALSGQQCVSATRPGGKTWMRVSTTSATPLRARC
ncbi:MmyB family transcriptional regulator [Streptomyces wuyuanensis]|uniref:MmyB family transcriptional regulator n=1 Tax=Streptomyces wuyuanensis TaxID=1196353 RepID=UPI00381B5451